MIGKVQSVVKSKSGKSWRVLIGKDFYGANFDSNIESAVGKSINFSFQNGDFGNWIESWALDNSTPAPQTATAAPQGHSNGGDRFYMPFVSNVVAHAIAAGRIQNPADLNQWAKAAYEAAQALDAL